MPRTNNLYAAALSILSTSAVLATVIFFSNPGIIA